MTSETLTPAELEAAERVLRNALKTDFCAFVEKTFQTVCPGQTFWPNWHLEAIGYALQRVAAGEIKRLIILVPPRSLKSICASVALPAWLLGRDPTRRIICVSYSADLAAKHARDCRAVMMAPWYQSVFPSTRLDPAKSAETEFMTTQRGFRLATSTGGTLTGRGGNIIIIDDPMKPADAHSDARRLDLQQWYSNTLLSRLDDKNTGAIVLVMQRLHIDDLAGYLMEQGGWEVLSLPAIAEVEQEVPIGPGKVHYRRVGDVLHPEREPLAVLERLKAEMGTYDYNAQYLQAPVPLGGNMIKWEWFVYFSDQPTATRGRHHRAELGYGFDDERACELFGWHHGSDRQDTAPSMCSTSCAGAGSSRTCCARCEKRPSAIGLNRSSSRTTPRASPCNRPSSATATP